MFSLLVVVCKWIVEGVEINCYGMCYFYGLCKFDLYILSFDEYDEVEYIIIWMSCCIFDVKEMIIFENFECGVCEFICVVDRLGNFVMGERWNNLYCFILSLVILS